MRVAKDQARSDRGRMAPPISFRRTARGALARRIGRSTGFLGNLPAATRS
ncbi:hypothetical protein [Lysobacter gummosus]